MDGTKGVDLFGSAAVDVALVEGLAVAEVQRRLGLAVRLGQVCQRAVAFYLAEVEARGLYQEWGYASAWQYAQQGLGMKKARASELLATGRRLRELPSLDRAFANGELCWSKVRAIARVATPETEAAWVAKASAASVQEVEGLVAVSQPGETPGELGSGLPRVRLKVPLVMNRVQHEQWQLAREKLGQECGRAVTDGELADELVRLLLSSDADGSVPGRKKVDGSLFRLAVDAGEAGDPAMEAAASDAAVPARLRRRVMARDGMVCRSCSSRRSLMVHHVVWWSHGGPTVAGNLVTLCARCHGLVHEGLLQVAGEPGRWTFSDRDGQPVRRGAPPAAGIRVRAELAVRTAEVRAGGEFAVRTAEGLVVGAGGEYAVRTGAGLPRAAAGGGAGGLGVGPRRPFTLDDIPAEIDGAWLRAHADVVEWGKDGRSLRLRKHAGRVAG